MADVGKKPDRVHPKIAATLGRQVWNSQGPQERINSAHAAFESLCQENDDEHAVALVSWLNGALYAYYVDCEAPAPMHVFRYLKMVYENLMHGLDPRGNRMAVTRQALFEAILGLWSGEDQGPASVAAFEWCSAVANPIPGCNAECSEWTSAMRSCRWALRDEERQVMVDSMADRCKVVLSREDLIDWWLDKYVLIGDFPRNVLLMLAAEQVWKGGLDLVRSRSRARRACIALETAGSSRGAWELCQSIAEKTAAFDEEVRKKVVTHIVAGHEGLFAGSGDSGNIALTYSEYSIGSHVLMTVMLPKDPPFGFTEDMRVRIGLHTFNFFMEKRSRKVYARLMHFGGIEIECWDHAEPSFGDNRSDD